MSRIQSVLAVLCFLFAFALYTHDLGGESLWRDEGLTVGRARQPVAQLIQNVNVIDDHITPDPHPPLYFLILSQTRQLLGESEFAYRLPSVWFVLLFQAVLFVLIKRLWGPNVALWGLIIAVLVPFFYWYAREARMYALLLLETALIFIFWLKLMRRFSWRDAAGLILSLVAAAATHYTALLFVPLTFGTLLLTYLRTNRRTLIFLIGGGVAAALLLIPVLNQVLELTQTSLFIFTAPTFWFLLRQVYSTFTLGAADPIYDGFWRLYPLIALGVFGLIAAALADPKERWRRLWLIPAAFALIMIAFYLTGFIQPNYSNPRHLITALLPLWLLILGGIAFFDRYFKPLAPVVALLVIGLTAQALWETVTAPVIIKDQLRETNAYIEERIRPGDLVVVTDAGVYSAYSYYAPVEQPNSTLWRNNLEAPPNEARLAYAEEWLSEYERIWYVDTTFYPTSAVAILNDAWDEQLVTRFDASWTGINLTLYSAKSVNQTAGPSWRSEDQWISGAGSWVEIDSSTATNEAIDLCVRIGGTILDACAIRPITEPGPFSQQIWVDLPAGLVGPTSFEIIQDGQSILTDEIIIAPYTPAEIDPILETDRLTLWQTDWNSTTARSSTWIVGYAVWETIADPAEVLVESRLVDRRGREVAPAEVESLTLGPDIQRQRLAYRVPDRIAPGRYLTQLRLAGTDDWVDLQTIEIEPWPLVDVLPANVAPLATDVRIGEAGQIQLVAADVQAEADAVEVTLIWQSQAEIDRNLGVFVHLGPAGQAPLTQTAAEPVGWTRPTAGWRTGEYIIDVHRVPLPENGSLEGLAISVGMYELSDPNIRPPLTLDGGFQPGGAFVVEEFAAE